VTSLTDKRIRDVSTSDAAIVVMLESGDVMALNDFSTRRIMSTKQLDVVKMVATGGHLDSRVVPNTDLVRLIVENRSQKYCLISRRLFLSVCGMFRKALG
jgi:hypothetical protein